MERLVFPRAAKVIVNTREFASALSVTEPDLDVSYFPNGIDLEELPRRDSSTVEQGSIAYIGTLYAGRNLSSVCAAMRGLLTDRPEEGATLRLNVAGPMRSTYGLQLQDDVAALGLASVVNIHGLLSHAKALELLSRSHLALVLAQNQPLCVPAKLYESVGLGVPTLVLAEDASASAHEARRIGAMTLDGRDVKGLRALLEDMLAGRIPTTIAARTSISYEDLAVQMDRLLQNPVGARDTDATRNPVESNPERATTFTAP
jgi:glycosyltransferase involved in cell wall biosynthesis